MFIAHFVISRFCFKNTSKNEDIDFSEKTSEKVNKVASKDLFFTLGDGSLTFLSGLGVVVILTGVFLWDLFIFDVMMKTALVVASILLGVFLFSLVFGFVVLIVDAVRRNKMNGKKGMEVRVIDRESKKEEKEQICGEKFLKFLYGGNFGVSKIFLNFLSKFSFCSKFYGGLQRRKFSKRKILSFVEKYNIKTDELEKDLNEFKSFNDFFIRKLKENSRKIVSDQEICAMPVDGRYLVFQNIETEDGFYVKGKKFNLEKFLGDKELAKKYEKGSMVIARLCPLDYHRFHFPDNCRVKKSKVINGFLYSVNPIALRKNIEIFCENKRVLNVLETKNFKDVLYVAVGAMNVGSIVSTYGKNDFQKKGEEMGYFELGGSTIVMLFEENVIKFDENLLKNSKKRIETKAFLGGSLGKKLF
jgi:phosphatidylserine decarboxylase